MIVATTIATRHVIVQTNPQNHAQSRPKRLRFLGVGLRRVVPRFALLAGFADFAGALPAGFPLP